MRYRKLYLLIFGLLTILGCSSRGSLTPEKAILGHWQREDKRAELYFSEDKRTIAVDGEKREPSFYIKRNIDDKSRKIIASLLKSSMSFTYTFNDSNTEMLEVETSTRWQYIDSKQEP